MPNAERRRPTAECRRPFIDIDRRGFLAGCAAPLLSAWQPSAGVTTWEAARRWERAVDAYLLGDRQPVAEVLALGGDTFSQAVAISFDAWSLAMSDIRPGTRRRAVRRLQGAAALALELPPPLTNHGRLGAALLLDTVGTTAVRILGKGDVARDVADGHRPAAEQTRRPVAVFHGRWHVAYLQMLLNDRRMTEAYAIAKRIALPDDDRAIAEAHYLRGLVHETNTRIADPKDPMQDVLLEPPRLPWINRQLGDASTWYRRALEASPSHREARLRLGRVELERGRHARAIELLQPLRDASDATWIGGLSWLFTGASHAALGSLDEARQAFDRAAQHPEAWQSGRIALMQLALRRGDLAQAADLGTGFAMPRPGPADDAPDAWLMYVSGPRPDHEAVLGPLREAILP